MFKQATTRLMLFLLASDLLLTELALYLASALRPHIPLGKLLPPQAAALDPWVYVLVAVIWTVEFQLLSVYDAQRVLRAVDELEVLIVAIVLSTLTFAGALYLSFRDISRLLFVYFFALDLLLLISHRLVLRVLYRWRGQPWPRDRVRVLIVGAGRIGREAIQMLNRYRWAGIHPVGFVDDDTTKQGQHFEGIPVLGPIDIAPDVVREQQVGEVLIALPLQAHERLAWLVRHLEELPVRVKVIPDYFALAFIRATLEDFAGIPVIGLREPVLNEVQRVVKRIFDLMITGLLLLVAWPLMLAIALAIKCSSPGPVMFRQLRVGENGRLFWMYKFRTMVADAEERQAEVLRWTEDGAVLHKHRDDPRVTRLGRFLRRSSLDELPQLFNVLQGEMSLVGPRPELPWLVDCYEPWQHKRFAVPQGITGWWQVKGRSDKPMHLHTEEDLYYIRNYSLLLDLQILWKTIVTVIRRRGAF